MLESGLTVDFFEDAQDDRCSEERFIRNGRCVIEHRDKILQTFLVVSV